MTNIFNINNKMLHLVMYHRNHTCARICTNLKLYELGCKTASSSECCREDVPIEMSLSKQIESKVALTGQLPAKCLDSSPKAVKLEQYQDHVVRAATEKRVCLFVDDFLKVYLTND